jgi:hypothetical protein
MGWAQNVTMRYACNTQLTQLLYHVRDVRDV